ncbi:electron transporter SenC [Achromobacter arsenitoxydans]|uniref:electron transporter SenC n=1 Tax=Achromobacter arsenitoxydans TaxID=1147684 RepID=UPI0002EDA2C1|nr:electron transporter SenC [Achromobacter arsenitoxydans]
MKAARAAWPALLAAGIALSAWQWHESAESPAGHGGHTHLHDDSGKPARLYDWDADSAAQVTLAAPAGSVSLTRGPQGWTASPTGAAQGFDAADFVALFSQARSDRILTAEAGETYGLAPPQLRIAVRDSAGAALALMDVGALAPDGLGRYVRLPDEAQIRIIPDYQTRAPLAAVGQDAPQSPSTPPLVKPALHKDK